MQTNSRDIAQLNEYQPLWLPRGDPADTTTVPSYEDVRSVGLIDGSPPHMNMRNGSVASLTISKRGNRSFVKGVAVCLLESVDMEHQQPAFRFPR